MEPQITVLKFGGSVLRSEADLPRAVHEIYRHWRKGSLVLAVVSAFDGTTDKLLRRAEDVCDEPGEGPLAALLATGEARSAAMLGLAVYRAGIPVRVLSPEQVGLRTTGRTLDAGPIAADANRLRKELKSAVVIVSGFVGLNDDGETTLLGRGGSDLTALFLAEELAARCILLKDVDGLYESNPNANGHRPRRYIQANWETALAVGGELVQPKAVHFAESRGLNFCITAPGATNETEIGALEDKLASAGLLKAAPLRVALLGCGTVGGGVYQRLAALPEFFSIVGVADRNFEKTRAVGVPSRLIAGDVDELIARDCDVVIELFGGVEPTRGFVRRALQLRRHVVTANKALLACEGSGLQLFANLCGVTLRHSASVGGVLPALEAVSRERELNEPRSVSGIVNGTCNFICDELAAGKDFGAAVSAAQQSGFAEADPELDLDGTDAAQKLVLLAREAFGVSLPLEKVKREGIKNLDALALQRHREQGRTVRLVAECAKTEDGIKASVKPTVLPLSHPFAQTAGADNCLMLETGEGTVKLIRGKGAGRWPTTEAVMADLFDVRRDVLRSRTACKAISEIAEVY